MEHEVYTALNSTLVSPNVPDSNGEPANVVDALDDLSTSARKIANAITPLDAVGGRDSDGGYIKSLTEATLSLAEGSREIASAIRDLAEAVREHSST